MNKLCVIDYHLRGPVFEVPSREADHFQFHAHGWLYHISNGGERQATDPQQQVARFGAWLLSPRRPGARPGITSIRVCWYDTEYAQASIQALATNPGAIIDGQPYIVDSMVPYTRDPLGPGDFLEMGANDPSTRVKLHTITPVGFRMSGQPHCTLDAATVAGSAMHRWERIWPGTLPGGLETDPRSRAWLGRVPMCRMDARTIRRRIDGQPQTGVKGSAEYVVGDLSVERRSLLLALLRFSEVAGLGSRTAYGFGAVRAEVGP